MFTSDLRVSHPGFSRAFSPAFWAFKTIWVVLHIFTIYIGNYVQNVNYLFPGDLKNLSGKLTGLSEFFLEVDL